MAGSTNNTVPIPQMPMVDIKTGLPTIPWYRFFENPQIGSGPDGTVGVSQGGTGITSGSPGGVLGFTDANTIASSSTLGLYQIVLGGGPGGTPSTPLGTGSSTTVLHGNANGIPSWGPVNLSTDVVGSITVPQGGTGLSSGISGGILGFVGTTQIASSVAIPNHAIVLGGGPGATPHPLASLGTATTVLHGNASGDPTFSAVSLSSDVSGTLPIANGGTGQVTASAAFDALAPTTTNQDLIVRGSSGNTRLPVGSNGQVLTVTAGVIGWVTGGGGASPLTTKGDLYTFSTINTRLPVGSNGQILSADSTQPTGLSWVNPGASLSYAATVLADSPVAFWQLAETSGTSAIDSSGNGNTGTYHGTFTFLGANGPGNLPGGVLLDGTTAYISVPGSATLNVGTTWTVEAWCLLELATTAMQTACLVTESFTGGANPVSFALGFNVDGSVAAANTIMGGYFTGSAWAHAVGPVINTADLVHLAVTYDNTNLFLYCNGGLIAKLAPGSTHVASNDGVILGAKNTAITNFVNGVLSCCAIYNTTLTPARIKAHYLAGR